MERSQPEPEGSVQLQIQRNQVLCQERAGRRIYDLIREDGPQPCVCLCFLPQLSHLPEQLPCDSTHAVLPTAGGGTQGLTPYLPFPWLHLAGYILQDLEFGWRVTFTLQPHPPEMGTTRAE